MISAMQVSAPRTQGAATVGRLESRLGPAGATAYGTPRAVPVQQECPVLPSGAARARARANSRLPHVRALQQTRVIYNYE